MSDLLHDDRYPDRPDHEDFWHLSEIILQLDGKFDHRATQHVEDFETFMKTIIDLQSWAYVALQRVMRIPANDVPGKAALYTEGFVLGYLFHERYGKGGDKKN